MLMDEKVGWECWWGWRGRPHSGGDGGFLKEVRGESGSLGRWRQVQGPARAKALRPERVWVVAVKRKREYVL